MAKSVQFAAQRGELTVQLDHAAMDSLPGGLCGSRLALQRADPVAQRGDGAHLFHVCRAALFVLAADLVDLSNQLGQLAFTFDQPSGNLAVVPFGRLDRLACAAQLLLEVSGARA